MRTKGTPTELEARWVRKAVLLGLGTGPNEVALLVGTSNFAGSRWETALWRRGPDWLKPKLHPGR
jgi:hypothetical protein